ncbi:GntR family transcriptional regulator [Streptomyces purpurogeneiscleroticus]|uniref:GntR family transcriptional regulator n=1 Tax=Streptomyces purpurogeneiscleroticus TaxID=68259 RepID=UPI001CBFA67E|nr:GntR family transcriptional regulator [Streptomyces purpurogeneiscleroticus]MBZ4016018.1 hypothetical protein [Streptomyces purpurogeneiscleroticus]
MPEETRADSAQGDVAADTVADRLRERISRGELPPGTPLPWTASSAPLRSGGRAEAAAALRQYLDDSEREVVDMVRAAAAARQS